MTKVDKLLEENSDVWKSKAALMSYIRGGIRRSLWNRHPSKTKLIRDKRFQIPNPNPNGKKPTVWGGECEICNNLFIEKDLQVDHIRDSGSSLRDIEDIQQFIEDIVIVTRDDLRWVCKNCHGIISYSQKMGISFEAAKIEKMLITIKKEKKVANYLARFGVFEIPKLKKDQENLLRDLLLIMESNPSLTEHEAWCIRELKRIVKYENLLDKLIEFGVESTNVPKTKKAQEELMYKLLLEVERYA